MKAEKSNSSVAKLKVLRSQVSGFLSRAEDLATDDGDECTCRTCMGHRHVNASAVAAYTEKLVEPKSRGFA